MRTLLSDPPPPAIERILNERRRLGLDRRDEVWDGIVHMIPPPNHAHERLASLLHRLLGPLADQAGLELTGTIGIGNKDDYRVPDLALHRPGAAAMWHPTAAIAVEILSPDDESWAKLPFYAAHRVDEVLIIDPQQHTVSWLGLARDDYQPLQQSRLIELGPNELAEQLVWPEPAE